MLIGTLNAWLGEWRSTSLPVACFVDPLPMRSSSLVAAGRTASAFRTRTARAAAKLDRCQSVDRPTFFGLAMSDPAGARRFALVALIAPPSATQDVVITPVASTSR